MTRLQGATLALVLAVVAPVPAASQLRVDGELGRVGMGRPSFDYYLSSYRGAGGAGEEAVGGRLMWSLAPLAPGRAAWLARTAVGAYLARSPDERREPGSWRFGAQADLGLGGAPLAGRVDPFLSLGVGARRLEQPLRAPASLLSVAPGVGVRLHLAPGLGIRGDARQVLEIRDGVRRDLELSGGLSLGA